MTDMTIQAMWVSYMDEVIPKGASPVQIQECKRAFVAGAKAVLGIVVAIGEDDVSEEQGVEILEGLQGECRAFVADVLEGRA